MTLQSLDAMIAETLNARGAENARHNGMHLITPQQAAECLLPRLTQREAQIREEHTREVQAIRVNHDTCHDLVCNGARDCKRGDTSNGCSCFSRAKRDAAELSRLRAVIEGLKTLAAQKKTTAYEHLDNISTAGHQEYERGRQHGRCQVASEVLDHLASLDPPQEK